MGSNFLRFMGNGKRMRDAVGMPTSPRLEDVPEISCLMERAKGSILFRQGEEGGIFVLCKGKAKLSMRSANGRQLICRKVGPGYLLGLPSSVRNAPYNFTAELLEDSQLAFVRQRDVPRFLYSHQELCLTALENLSAELIELRRAAALAAKAALD
jgi:CRP-like cAMP-binding protein